MTSHLLLTFRHLPFPLFVNCGFPIQNLQWGVGTGFLHKLVLIQRIYLLLSYDILTISGLSLPSESSRRFVGFNDTCVSLFSTTELRCHIMSANERKNNNRRVSLVRIDHRQQTQLPAPSVDITKLFRSPAAHTTSRSAPWSMAGKQLKQVLSSWSVVPCAPQSEPE